MHRQYPTSVHHPNKCSTHWPAFRLPMVWDEMEIVILILIYLNPSTASNTNLFTDKWQWPCKHIHEIWKPVRVRWAIKLSNIHYIVFIFQYSGLKIYANTHTHNLTYRLVRSYQDEQIIKPVLVWYLVIVNIQIIWRRKYRNQRWKTCCLTLSIHSVSEIEWSVLVFSVIEGTRMLCVIFSRNYVDSIFYVDWQGTHVNFLTRHLVLHVP